MGTNDVLSTLRRSLQSPVIFTSNVRKLIKTKDLTSLDAVLASVRMADDSDSLLLLWQFLLDNLFPVHPERRMEEVCLQKCLVALLDRPEIATNSSRKADALTTATLQLAARLNAHPNKLDDLESRRGDTQFCTRLLAFAYLQQETVRQQVVAKVAQVTQHRDWFKKPMAPAGSAFPHWVASLLPVTVQSTDVTTFEQALLHWFTVEPPLDDKPLPFHSHDEAALFASLVDSGEFFFTFVTSLIQSRKVETVANDQWVAAIPHYNTLITVALRLLHEAAYKRQFYDFSAPKHANLTLNRANQDVVLALSGHLLKNVDLVHICVLALFESTNLANPKSVGVCLDRLAAWMALPGVVWLSSIKTSPAEFNWTVAIRLLLHCEHAEVVLRTLQFLYKVLGVLPWELRHRLLRSLAQRHFALFLHWHCDVRVLYHHVLVYKICPHVHRAVLDSATDVLLLRTDMPSIDDLDDSHSSGSRGNHSTVAREVQVWRNFDGFVALVCFQERARAMDANKAHKREMEFAQNRVAHLAKLMSVDDALARLSVESTNSEPLDKLPAMSSMLSVADSSDVDVVRTSERLALAKLSRAPPYLRHVPDDEVQHLESVVRAACPSDINVLYPNELQVYARESLKSYVTVLQAYYDSCVVDTNGDLMLGQLPPPPSLD
ncbi:hypothetical protein DYB25_000607 [Aphanomyces astaci]|uniref:Uncharacterized protein n=2 Tax=Aphanomyces astaci TaxID=112090 RepID=A0A397D3F0_APHAT|nr:hypothetical protein DYB25_000607 [Aphanomyces astaci]RHY52500.1 hypothetical protein DYB34_000710 [Aphanomyces astaci]RHY55311.1 hypothetical protein DYB38_009518 [Aphanomyces astaci]RHY56323.1 hypothetical protein DYB30_000854 [Aphanomyces astaci]RHZ06355.1 hypothetical protein DYB31_000774 [Aphanomyces astaci]